MYTDRFAVFLSLFPVRLVCFTPVFCAEKRNSVLAAAHSVSFAWCAKVGSMTSALLTSSLIVSHAAYRALGSLRYE